MIKIFTDTSADLPLFLREEYDIKIFPMTITIGEETYIDQINLSNDEFYVKLAEAKQLAKTAFPTPKYMYEQIKAEVDAGNEVLIFPISSELSGCYKALCLLAEEFGDKVAVIDTKSATLGQGVIVLAAAQAVQNGVSFAEAIRLSHDFVARSEGFGAVSNLECLLRGGRMNLMQAVAATALNIRPIVQVDAAGTLSLAQKVRGNQKALQYMVDRIVADGPDFTQVPFYVAYTDAPTLCDQFWDMLEEAGVKVNGNRPTLQVGPTVGTHLGPGLCAAFYLKPDKK